MRALVIAAAALLGACSANDFVPPAVDSGPAPRAPVSHPPISQPRTVEPPVRQPVPATPLAAAPADATPVGVTKAAAAGLVRGPAVADLPITREAAERALTAFKLSCPSLQRRPDLSGLTRGEDWAEACRAASATRSGEALAFFNRYFEAVQVADGKAHATGYYEPEIAGSRTRGPGYQVPVYAKPGDLIDVDLGAFNDELKGKRVRGRVEGTNLVPYHDRAAITSGAIEGRVPVIAWAADPVEMFFLEVQGSGRLRLPDGGVMRIGFAGQNGRGYTGIGKLMRDRGLLAPGQATMQGIMAWIRANPAEGRAIMNENKSFVFFQELKGPGPLGAMGLPVTPLGTVAADPQFIPLGAPVFLSMDRAEANGLWIAQDTGGAIKGSNRVDTFWGAGPEARAIAGGMNSRGTAWLLLPAGTLDRLAAAPPQ